VVTNCITDNKYHSLLAQVGTGSSLLSTTPPVENVKRLSGPRALGLRVLCVVCMCVSVCVCGEREREREKTSQAANALKFVRKPQTLNLNPKSLAGTENITRTLQCVATLKKQEADLSKCALLASNAPGKVGRLSVYLLFT
jgi:hypothetical protein